MAEENKSKLQSRKFVVWLVWLVLTGLYTVFIGAYLFITKKVPDSLIELWGVMIQYFFVISCLYLGVNLAQKGVYAAKDYFAKKKEDTTDAENVAAESEGEK